MHNQAAAAAAAAVALSPYIVMAGHLTAGDVECLTSLEGLKARIVAVLREVSFLVGRFRMRGALAVAKQCAAEGGAFEILGSCFGESGRGRTSSGQGRTSSERRRTSSHQGSARNEGSKASDARYTTVDGREGKDHVLFDAGVWQFKPSWRIFLPVASMSASLPSHCCVWFVGVVMNQLMTTPWTV